MHAADRDPYHLLVDQGSFSLRVGRGWLENPAYRGATGLWGAPAEGEGILDVLHIEVDGVNAAPNLRESPLPRVLEDLGRAIEALFGELETAVVQFGSPTAELVLLRSGPKVLVSLIVQDPSLELRLDDLEIDFQAFSLEVLAAIRAFMEDAKEIDPPPSDPALARLSSLLHRLDEVVFQDSPPRISSRLQALDALPSAAISNRAPSGSVSFECELFEAVGPLPRSTDGRDLHTLLRKGRLSLFDSTGRALAGWEGPPFLAFRSLVVEAREILSNWDGSSEAILHLGSAKLKMNLSGDEILGPGGSCRCKALEALVTGLGAAIGFCERMEPLFRPVGGNPYLQDLAEEASELLAHCLDLLEGDRLGPPPMPEAAARGSRAPTISRRPLTPWKLRRVNIVNRWSFDAGPLLRGGFGLLGRRLLVAGEYGVRALDTESGRPAWGREGVDAVWLGPDRGSPILLSTFMGLEMITPAGATAWSNEPLDGALDSKDRYLRGSGNLIVLADGRQTSAYRESNGGLSWSFSPPGVRRGRLGGGQAGVLFAGDTGFLHAIDADSGLARWRVRTNLSPLSPPECSGGRVLLIGEGEGGPTLFSVDAATGGGAAFRSISVDEIGPPVRTKERLIYPASLRDNSAIVLVGPEQEAETFLIEGLIGLPTLLPDRLRLLAVDRQGVVAALGQSGRRLWRSETSSGGSCGPPPILAAARGVLLLAHHDGLHILDMADGELLGWDPMDGMPEISHMSTGKDLDVYLADSEGAIHACRIGTRMAVVT